METDALEQDIIKRARDDIERRTGKSLEQLYSEREKRINDAAQLKIPDRVPVYLKTGAFVTRYAGIFPSTPFYKPAAYKQALVKTLLDFEPDAFRTTNGDNVSGFAMEFLDDKQVLWPGGSIRPDQDLQFKDREIMRENEYDLFMTDPGDFVMRYYLPRRFGVLSAFSNLPPLLSYAEATFNLVSHSSRFISPEIVQAFNALYKAGQEQAKYDQWQEKTTRELGFPMIYYSGGMANPPFDLFATYLRGMHGTMIDMFRRPEKLLAGMEKIMEYRLARIVRPTSDKIGRRVHAGGNHFQSEEFLSRKQFDTFPWPTWKKSLLATIDMGFIPSPLMEGKNDDRIECFLELPKGKALIMFAQIDIVRAKDILGGHLCILGGVPGSLLWGGSPHDVEEYCKNLIKVCGKNGGFILGCTNPENAKPENVKAMIDSAKKYGRYD